MAWWIKTKREEKQRVMRPQILREIKQEAANLCLPNSFNATDWMDRFLHRHKIGDNAEKRRGTKNRDQLNEEVQKFHNHCHSVCSAPMLNVAKEDTYNLDEVPNSLTGFMRRNIRSLNDKGTANEVRKSPFTESDFIRSKTDLFTIKYQEKDEQGFQPIKPIIIYKMKDTFKPSAAELSKYSKDVTVTFQKCCVIDINWMLRHYLPKWGPGPGKLRFVVYDSATTHVTQAVKDAFANQNTSMAVGFDCYFAKP